MITDHSIVIRKIILSMWLNTLRLCMRDSKASIQRVASSRAFKKAQLFNPVTWSFQTATWYSLTLFGISAACDPLSLKRPWAPMRLNVCFAFKELCLPSESAGKPQLASIFSSVEAFYALPRLCGPQAKRGCASLSHCLTVSRIMGEQTHIFVKVDLPRNCSASLTWYLPKRKNDLASPRRIPDFGARAVRPIQQSDKW